MRKLAGFFFLTLAFPLVPKMVPKTRAYFASYCMYCSCTLDDTVSSLRKGTVSSVTRSASG